MKTHNLFRYLLQVVGLLSLMALGACTTSPTALSATDSTARPVLASDVTNVDQNGNTALDQTALSNALDQSAIEALIRAEIESILYMREEEKLARDVYLTLYQQWGLPIFQNIAGSEATHMEAVKNLVDRYGLEDPAIGQDIGVFVNPTLQGLYDQLVADGGKSPGDALRVGAAIEEIDILDLEEAVAQTDKADIRLVYQNLTKGSRNHLRSFTSTLEKQTGEIYQPQYLDPAVYEEIISTPRETGGNDQRQGQGQSQSGRRGQRG
jgi:hypothetical protein